MSKHRRHRRHNRIVSIKITLIVLALALVLGVCVYLIFYGETLALGRRKQSIASMGTTVTDSPTPIAEALTPEPAAAETEKPETPASEKEPGVSGAEIGDLSGLTTSGSATVVEAINELNAGKLDKDQGTQNAGKILVVGDDGVITAQDQQALAEAVAQAMPTQEAVTTEAPTPAATPTEEPAPEAQEEPGPGIRIEHTDGGTELYLADENGDDVVSFAGGNIRTEHFSSDNGIYEQRFEYTNEAGTETISHFFPRGTRLAFHLTIQEKRSSDAIESTPVTYQYTDTSGEIHTLGSDYGYNFPEYTLETDAASVSVAYVPGLNGENGATLSFRVYSTASFPRELHVLTVAPEGKEYSSLREAIRYASEYADAMNRYEIHVYPGTYDMLSYYTPEEIAQDGFRGLFLTNGISLIGIGQGSEIILTASMNPDEYAADKRDTISTLNISGNVTVRNMTIKAENIRHAVWDDTGLMPHQEDIHTFEEVTFTGTNLTPGGGNRSFGAGGGNNKRMYFRNCDFSDAMAIHTADNMAHEFTAYLENCRARMMVFSDYNSGIPSHIFLKNCAVSRILLERAGGKHPQYLQLEGEGTGDAMVTCPAGYVYALDGVHKFYGSDVKAGKAVQLTGTMAGVTEAISPDRVYGISIGTADGATYVQTEGWINSNTLGLVGLAAGDYLTVEAETGYVVGGGTAENAIAQVKLVDADKVAYAKLTD